MGVPNRQIGWSQESNLLWYILSQLKKLTSVIFSLKPKYKVYTALLTQSGGDNSQDINTGELTIGVTYLINDSSAGMDFTNVGAPNNDLGTYFVATGTKPNSWGIDEGGPSILLYNTGAPTVTVLENTIGNVWFTYDTTGSYNINSDNLFVNTKTFIMTGSIYSNGQLDRPGVITSTISTSSISLIAVDIDTLLRQNDMLLDTPIEIRVYN